MATTLNDFPQDIIQTDILPRLDGQSLSTISTVSTDLHTLCSDHKLWSHTCMCMWPSITHPRVHEVVSTFPDGHRSFFHDSFPSLITDINCNCNSQSNIKQPGCSSTHPWPSQLISAVDIRYQTDIIYSTVHFTDVTPDFMSSEFVIMLNEHIDMEVDVLVGVDKATLAHLKETVTLNWIVIDPLLKRAGNLSTIKPVSVKREWVSNKTIVKYVTVLPGCDLNEVVQCCIRVVLGSDDKWEGLHVKEVTMKLYTLDSYRLDGLGFLFISRGAILGENNVRRKVLDDKERWEMRHEFKEMKRKRRELERKEDKKIPSEIILEHMDMFVLFCLSIYLMSLVLRAITYFKECL